MITSIKEFILFLESYDLGKISKTIVIDFDIEHTNHSLDRKDRDFDNYIKDQEIKDTINLAAEQITDALIENKLNMGDRVLITNKQTDLNIVGGLGLKGDDILFKVITIMKDKNFRNIKNTYQIFI